MDRLARRSGGSGLVAGARRAAVPLADAGRGAGTAGRQPAGAAHRGADRCAGAWRGRCRVACRLARPYRADGRTGQGRAGEDARSAACGARPLCAALCRADRAGDGGGLRIALAGRRCATGRDDGRHRRGAGRRAFVGRLGRTACLYRQAQRLPERRRRRCPHPARRQPHHPAALRQARRHRGDPGHRRPARRHRPHARPRHRPSGGRVRGDPVGPPFHHRANPTRLAVDRPARRAADGEDRRRGHARCRRRHVAALHRGR